MRQLPHVERLRADVLSHRELLRAACWSARKPPPELTSVSVLVELKLRADATVASRQIMLRDPRLGLKLPGLELCIQGTLPPPKLAPPGFPVETVVELTLP